MKKTGLMSLVLALGITFAGCSENKNVVERKEKQKEVVKAEYDEGTSDKTQQELPEINEYIESAKAIGQSEEAKNNEWLSFSDDMYNAALTYEDVCNNPDKCNGSNIQVRGVVLEKIPHADERMCNFYVEVGKDKKVFVSYYLEEDHLPVEEGRYVNVWGIFRGLGEDGFPVVEKVYLYTNDEGGTNFDYDLPEFVKMRDYLTGNTFVSESGEEITFPTGEESFGGMWFHDFGQYEDYSVVYYEPSQFGIYYDENGNPPQYLRIVLFDDGAVTTFAPDENTQSSIYSANNGEYAVYVKK